MNKKLIAFMQMFLVLSLSFTLALTLNPPAANAQEEQQVCCEQDNSGNFCSYVPSSQCTSAGVFKAATSCDQTSFCSSGCCSGIDGFCYSGYPKALCEDKGGSFSRGNCNQVNECKLGCCIIGTQADYVTKDRCIEETGDFPDLEVDFREDVNSEQECLNLARNLDQGCCVTPEGSCAFGAKSECTADTVVNGTGFYKDTYCSDNNLRGLCECAPHNQNDFRATTCLPDKDEVYWKDSCGNPEGIVESGLSRYGGAKDDGNCDYNQGTLCGDSDGDGIHTCESLDCESGTRSSNSENKDLSVNLEDYEDVHVGKSVDRGDANIREDLKENGILNGESWCLWDSENQIQKNNPLSTADRQGKDPPGSRYYRSICINGQELVEPCKDFREEYCYYNTIDVKLLQQEDKKYTESRCIENEWEPCANECNTANPLTMSKNAYEEALKKDQECCLGPKKDCTWNGNKCTPAVSPGFKFWEAEGAEVCSKANMECSATFVCGGWNRIIGCDEDATTSGLTFGSIFGLGAGAGTAIALGGFATGPVLVGTLGAGLLVGGSASGWFGTTADTGWQIVAGSECLSQNYLQAANNLCRSYGDCGADFNYLVDSPSFSDTEKEKFLLSKVGFSNTENINDELADYSRENIGKLKERKSDSRVTETIEFAFDGSGEDDVPGNFSQIPDWDKGKDFFDFTVPKGKSIGIGGRLKGALFTGNELRGQPWYTTSAFISLVGGLGFGLIGGGIATTGTAGQGTLLGFRASPLGFLISGIANQAGLQLFKGTGTLAGAREAATKVAETATKDLAAKQSAETTARGAYINAIKSQQAAEQAYDEIVKNLVGEPTKAIDTKKAYDAANLNVQTTQKSLEQSKIATQEAQKKLSQETAKSTSTFPQYMTGVSAAMWAYTIFQLGDVLFEQVKTAKVSTTCQPWQAPNYKIPKEEDPCERCNPQWDGNGDEEKEYVDEKGDPVSFRAKMACSEYRCKSLGAACELLNQGSEDETCVSLNKLDTNSPKIKPWPEGFTIVEENQIVETETGFKIDGDLPIYTVINMGLQTDEPAQCKMSLDHSLRYDEMPNNFFGGNTYKYFHLTPMVYPAGNEGNSTSINLIGGGAYKLYLRCIDAVGNANENDYVIEFNVEQEPDLTPPTIVGSSIQPPNIIIGEQSVLDNEVFLTHGSTYADITLFVNEPAECRYDYNPLDFNIMNTTNSCKASTLDSPPYYSCNFVRGLTAPTNGVGPAPSGFVSRAGLTKYVYFKCIDHPEAGYDGDRNFNKDAYTVILRGSDSLNITDTQPSALIKTSTSIVNVTLETRTTGGADLNGNSICKYTTEENLKDNIVAMTEFLNTGTSLHTQPWQPGSGEQKFYVGCYDKAGNIDYGTIEFNVEQDVTPPFITKIYTDKSLQPPQFTIEINEAGECKDSTEKIFDYETEGNLMNKLDTEGKKFSSSTPGSNLYYVICKDSFGNEMPAATVQIAEA